MTLFLVAFYYLLSALADILLKKLLLTSSVLFLTITGLFLRSIGIALYYKFSGLRGGSLNSEIVPHILKGALFRSSFTAILSVWALQYMPVTRYSFIVITLGPAISAGLSFILLGETIGKRNLCFFSIFT